MKGNIPSRVFSATERLDRQTEVGIGHDLDFSTDLGLFLRELSLAMANLRQLAAGLKLNLEGN